MTTAPTTNVIQGRTRSGLGPLYELTQDVIHYADLIQEIMSNEDYDEAERDRRLKMAMDELDKSSVDVNTKLTSIRNYIKALEIESDGITREIERLQKRKAARAGQIKGLKDYAAFELRRLDGKKIKTDLFTISLQLGPPKVIIDDEKAIPSIRKLPDIWTAQLPKLNKTAIRDLLKSDENAVPGCHLEREEGIRIR